MPFPDYLDRNPRIIFFTDFDGTVTTDDMCDWLVATDGYGSQKLRESSQAVVDGTMHFRDASQEQLESITIGFDKCVEKAMAHVQLDKHFLDFYNWATLVSIPIVILSGGLVPLIEATLKQFMEHELHGIEVVANSIAVKDGFKSVNEDGGAWRVQFRDNSIYGNDKAQAIKPYAKHRKTMAEADKPILLFAGDGISDLSAAGYTDLLFAKQGEDLIEYCKRQQLPFIEFQDWASILKTTQDLYYGKKSVAEVVAEKY
ncbi:phosphoserine phosphatase [Byssothecium circinans]|uniref:Phosphoserine phosphatase n=1 Tax=Byssothecium circinans TaxID=147558 RepID=A0A6A5U998_9PLEO|nr:phosphoserine phosphatase [Byssothecium circinans]